MTRPATAALSTLIILQLVMLAALLAQISPHPPKTIPLFAIAPFLAVSLSAATSAILMDPTSAAGRVLSVLTALCALLSFGPQKYFDPQFALIWPAVICGQLAAITLFYTSFKNENTQ